MLPCKYETQKLACLGDLQALIDHHLSHPKTKKIFSAKMHLDEAQILFYKAEYGDIQDKQTKHKEAFALLAKAVEYDLDICNLYFQRIFERDYTHETKDTLKALIQLSLRLNTKNPEILFFIAQQCVKHSVHIFLAEGIVRQLLNTISPIQNDPGDSKEEKPKNANQKFQNNCNILLQDITKKIKTTILENKSETLESILQVLKNELTSYSEEGIFIWKNLFHESAAELLSKLNNIQNVESLKDKIIQSRTNLFLREANIPASNSYVRLLETALFRCYSVPAAPDLDMAHLSNPASNVAQLSLTFSN